MDSLFKTLDHNSNTCKAFDNYLDINYKLKLQDIISKRFELQLGFLISFLEHEYKIFISCNDLSYIVIDKSELKPLGQILEKGYPKGTVWAEESWNYILVNYHIAILRVFKTLR